MSSYVKPDFPLSLWPAQLRGMQVGQFRFQAELGSETRASSFALWFSVPFCVSDAGGFLLV